MADTKYNGLSAEEVAAARQKYGMNVFSQNQKTSFVKTLLASLTEPVFMLLIGASLIYFLLGQARDGCVMLVFVVFMCGINMYQEWRTDKTLEALKDLTSPRVKVIRGGEESEIISDELVPGDIMMLEEGGKVPADGVILFADGCGIDESSLTGESDIVWKVNSPAPETENHWKTDRCYSGTNVVAGRAVVRVDATGLSTEYGKIGKDIADAPDRPTPLEKQTRVLVRDCSIFSFVLLILVVTATILNGSGFINAALAGITIAMGTIPEEFPVVLTVFLAMGAWRLAHRKALVRRIPSVETLGAVTVLCVDKTGTLTRNLMELRECLPFGQHSENELLEVSAMACETSPYDPMEKAMLECAARHGIDVAALQGRKLLHEFPFSSESRMMGHIWETDKGVVLAAKGSPENIMALCELDEEGRGWADAEQRRMSDNGCRVLAVARMSNLSEIPDKLTDCRLELIGLTAFMDPPRRTVPASIRACRNAGVRVAMITGDNSITAHRIAHEVGLGSAGEEEHQIISGDELDRLDDSELTERLKKVTIFSRILPRQKMRIVKAFHAAGEVVAMTGDGVNDAPALKYADIGIAMGGRGTQVAREAADIVLLNDDFSTIVNTIRDGRRIYDNIRKAMGYVIVIHLPIALSALAAPLLGLPTLLLPIHIVLLELIIDPTCSIVFERQPEEPDIMNRPPRPVHSSIITKKILTKAILQGLVIFAAVFGSYLLMLPREGAEHSRTFFLASLVLSNLFIVYANRSNTQFAFARSKNSFDPVPWIVNLAILAGLIAISRVPSLASMAKVKPLSLKDFAFAAIIAAAASFWWEIVKFIRRHRDDAKISG